VQPAQLSLLPDEVPVPAPLALAELPEHDVGEAISLLGALIAKASMTGLCDHTAPDVEVRGDD
jgi:hypothetical protein